MLWQISAINEENDWVLNQNSETLIESDLHKVNLDEHATGKIENQNVVNEEKESTSGPNHLVLHWWEISVRI